MNGAQASQGHMGLWVPTNQRSSITQDGLSSTQKNLGPPEDLLSAKFQFRSHPEHNPHYSTGNGQQKQPPPFSAEHCCPCRFRWSPTNPHDCLCSEGDRTEMLQVLTQPPWGARIPSRPGMALPEPDHPYLPTGVQDPWGGDPGCSLSKSSRPSTGSDGRAVRQGATDPPGPTEPDLLLSFSSCMRALSVYFCAFSR